MSRGNLAAGAVVFLLVGGFFFLPELVHIESDSEGEYVEETAVESATEVEKDAGYEVVSSEEYERPVEEAPLEADSPLSMVSAEIASEEARASLARQEEVVVAPVDEAPQSNDLEKEVDGPFPPQPDITWAQLIKPATAKLLQSAVGRSLKLGKRLSADYAESREALLSYSSGVENVLEKGKGILSPSDVLKYLDGLDRNVTEMMTQEGVPRELLMTWSEISLGDEIQSALALRKKQQAVRAYNPRITLVGIEAMHWGKRDFPDPEHRAQFRLRGFIVGTDTSKLWYFRNGDDTQLKRVLILRPDGKNRRVFNVQFKVEPKEVITFRGVDVRGDYFDKSYLFDPRVRRFPYRSFPAGIRYVFPFKSLDPRVDRFFRRGPGRLNSEHLPEEGRRSFGTF